MAESHVIGIDLGGTKILSVCLDESLSVVGRDLRPTEADKGPQHVFQRMADSARAAADGRELAGVGISTPGPADSVRGIVTTPPNLPGWHNVPLAEAMGDLLHLPCWLDKDANCAAVAEHRLGAGRGADDLIYVTLGTGVGGGLVLGGRLYGGASGAAGELGHLVIDPAGRRCNCGRRGCLEALVGGYYLGLDAAAIIASQPDGILARLARHESARPDAQLLSRAADAGDADADAAIRRAGEYLGSGLASLVNLLNPQVIVLGGSLLHLGERFLEPARRLPETEPFEQHRADLRIVEAALGEEAPVVGAALLARDHLGLSAT